MHVPTHTTSDGCSFWPDGIPTWMDGSGDEWLHCCVAHDLGGTDWGLGACVSETAPWVGVLMFLGLVTFGFVYRWGRVELRRRRDQ